MEEDSNPQIVSNMFSLLGDLYANEDRMTEAFAAYDSALVYVEDNISCLNNYAYFLSLRNERLDEAEAMSYRTIKAEPENKTYLDTYAWILFTKKDYVSARIYIDKVVRPDASDDELLADSMLQGNILEHAGDIYAAGGMTEEALRYWQLAVKKADDTCTKTIRKKISKNSKSKKISRKGKE